MLKIGEYLAKLQARPWLSRALGVPDHLTAMPPCNLSLIACFMSLHTVVWQVWPSGEICSNYSLL